LLSDLGDNLVWVEAGSRNVAGVRTGTHGTQSLTLDDALAIQREVELVRFVSPQVDGNVLVVGTSANWSTRSRGVSPAYLTIKRWRIASGGVFTDDDVDRAANVCLIGQTVRTAVFGDADPIGAPVRIGGQPFVVAGVLWYTFPTSALPTDDPA
jgi:putative ABC transport system permease protein